MSRQANHDNLESRLPRIQIRVRGQLDANWTRWFDGLALSLAENGDTLMTGTIADQAALFGILKKVRDLGLPLIALNPIE